MEHLLQLILDPAFPSRATFWGSAGALAVCALSAVLVGRAASRLRLRAKIMYGLFLVSLGPMALMAFLDIQATYRALLVSTRHALHGMASQASANLDAFLYSTLDEVRTQALLPGLARFLLLPPDRRPGSEEEAWAMGILSSLKRRDQVYISSYALMDAEGRVAADTFGSDVGMAKGDREYFRESMKSEMPYVSDITVSQRTGEPSLFFCSPVRGPDGRVAGILRVRYKAALIQRFMFQENDRLGPGSFAILAGEGMERLADSRHPDSALAAHPQPSAPPLRLPSPDRLRDSREKGELFLLRPGAPGLAPGIAAAAALRGKPWTVVYSMPAGEFLSGVVGQLFVAALLLCLIGVAVVLVSLFIAGRIAGPISRLAEVARRLGRGDFTVQAQASSGDEIGMLSEDFNRMTAALRRRMDLEVLLSDLSRNSARISPQGLEALLDQAAGSVGVFLDVDRVHVHFLTDEPGMPGGRQWCAPGVAPRTLLEAGASGPDCPWLRARLERLEEVVLPDLGQLDPAAEAEGRSWREAGVKSLLCVPLAPGGRLLGCLSCETERTARAWQPEYLRLMHLAGETLANAYDRLRSEEQLRRAHDQLERKVEERTRELTEANRRLLEADEIKSAFLSSASHELRTPLTSVLGFAKLAGRSFGRHFLPLAASSPDLSKKARVILENMSIIEKEGERLTRLVNDLLDLNKIESGRMEWRDQVLDAAALLTAAFNTVRGPDSRRRGVEFVLDLAPGLPAIRADRDRITQVMLNLLDNAVKFTSHGAITLRAASVGQGWLEIRVEDTGRGIPEQDLEMIFDKFYQVAGAGAGADKPRGTGLGLAICRQIVAHSGGRITASSVPGRGSVFTILLPAAGAE
ncbi:MAG: ATP-binding protein [Thermodesulfobacteriota bacterium]